MEAISSAPIPSVAAFVGPCSRRIVSGSFASAYEPTSRKKPPIRITAQTATSPSHCRTGSLIRCPTRSISRSFDNVAAQQELAERDRADEPDHREQQRRLEIDRCAAQDSRQHDQRDQVDDERVEGENPIDDVGPAEQAIKGQQRGQYDGAERDDASA